MMRKNNTLLTIDLRNNPGYDENIHSRLVMKMSKNIHFLYQQYQRGAYTEEEFENLKNYIEILLKGLLNHEKIKFLDLSDNNFNDRYGNMISRIIIRQSQRRDQIIWSFGLRNEFPANNDYAKGLISINLHGNKLGEKSTDKICYALCSDQYLRAVIDKNTYFSKSSYKSPHYIVFQEFQKI